jgi:pilus assembly protein CpaB
MKGMVVTALMVGGALAAGGGAAYVANGYIDTVVSERRAELEAQYKPVQVVVASADLRPGALVTNQTVALRDMPRAFLHAEAVLAEHWGGVAGRVLARTIRSGEPLLLSHLAQDATAGFSAQLNEGMRALTIPVDEEASISGMLAPGDRIDLFFTTTSGNESVTLPLLLNVPVIATGIRTLTNASYLRDGAQPAHYRTVTVSVSPDDAAKITLAQDAGKLTVTLRQPQDEAPIQVARVTKHTLLNGNRFVQAAAPRRRVEIILGGSGS